MTAIATARPFLRVLLGATASGKEEMALACAEHCGAEIISVDSMKIYRSLEIGTAKPPAMARARVPHHCLDLAEPTEEYNVAKWLEAAEAAIADIARRGRRIILVGGTALYYKGLLEGLFSGPPASPILRQDLYRRAQDAGVETLHALLRQHDHVAADRIHPRDLRRVVRALEVIMVSGRPVSAQQREWLSFAQGDPKVAMPMHLRYPCAMVGLRWPPAIHAQRIAARIDRMLQNGLLDEARRVYENRWQWSRSLLQAVAYKEFFPYFAGQARLDEARALLHRHTRRLAKAQRTWFRKFPCVWFTLAEERRTEDVAAEICRLWDEAEMRRDGLHNCRAGDTLRVNRGVAEK